MLAAPPSKVIESPVVLVIVPSVRVITRVGAVGHVHARRDVPTQAHLVVEGVDAVGVVELQAVARGGVDDAGVSGQLA